MRILHISDFHLDIEDKEDSINHIIEPLKKSLSKIQIDKPIDLILFTGDLVNIGGKNYSDITEGFMDFEETLIEPILKTTGLDKNRFYFVPGNHDINRNADSKFIDDGIEKGLDNQEKINKFINSPEGNNRIKSFTEFEKYF